MTRIHLRVLDANGEVLKEIDVQEFPLRMGRGSECNLVIEDPKISHVHAQLEMRGSDLYLFDLKSRNGCFTEESQKVTELKIDLFTKTKVRLAKTWIEICTTVEEANEKTIDTGTGASDQAEVQADPVLQLPAEASALLPIELMVSQSSVQEARERGSSENKKDAVEEPSQKIGAAINSTSADVVCPPRINRRRPPPLTIVPEKPTNSGVVHFDFVDRLRERVFSEEWARFSAGAFAILICFIYQHEPAEILVTLGLFGIAVLSASLISASLTWGLARLLGRTYQFKPIMFFYLACFFVSSIFNELYQFSHFVWPDNLSIAFFFLAGASLVSIFVVLTNLRVVFNLRGKIFNVSTAIFLSLWILFFGAKIMGTQEKWKNFVSLRSIRNVPYRFPASTKVDAQKFLNELDESLDMIERRSNQVN